MRICIHRGTRQVGGTCIELESKGKRVLLDLGRPLDAEPDATGVLPQIAGLRDGNADLLAILLSHPHQDHVGLVELTHPSIPVLIGAAAASLLNRAAEWLGRPLLSAHPLVHWNDRKPIDIGPFRITPYLVDHSAYDAYALLVEADGERLFYSGDFRGHGRKSALFDRFVADPPGNIDVLLMEGTVIGRDVEERDLPTEADIEEQFVERLRAAEGLSLVWTSSQNIDRIVTVFRAARRTGKRLILDAFTAEMLDATGNPRLPQADWGSNVGVYVPEWMRRKIKRDGAFDTLGRFAANRVFLDRLTNPENEVLLFRPGLRREVAESAPLRGAQLVFSNWSGYLDDPSTAEVRSWLLQSGIPIHRIHTSGHASVPDLKRFAKAIDARMLVPIHSFATQRFGRLFKRVRRKSDGQWWRPPRSDADYLREMAKYARLLRQADLDHARWAAADRYARINGDGVRPISIGQENPCGKLLLSSANRTKTVGNLRRDLRRINEVFAASTSPTAVDGEAKPLWSHKRELRVQAWIIKQALTRRGCLRDLLHLADLCEEVRFVTDELALNGIRADLLLLARKGQAWFPVFVELKAKRAGEVVTQLKNIHETVGDTKTCDAFRGFINATNPDVDAADVQVDRSAQLMIWPRSQSPRTKLPIEVRVLEFDPAVLDRPPDSFEVEFRPTATIEHSIRESRVRAHPLA